MTRKRRAHAYALPLLLAALLATPALAGASTGGSALGAAPSGAAPPAGASPTPSGGPVSATGDGITLLTSANTMLRNQLSFSGTAPRRDAGRTIEIERLGHQTGWAWAPTISATVGNNGSFGVTWRANHIGRFAIRAVIGQGNTAGAAAAAPVVTVTIYRAAVATEYGPGFFGRRTACGRRLTRTTVGVANRSLRCGTKVAILYRGRTMVVPVIDRGPYANSADWDLTMATGRALGMGGTARIGAVSLPRPPASAG